MFNKSLIFRLLTLFVFIFTFMGQVSFACSDCDKNLVLELQKVNVPIFQEFSTDTFTINSGQCRPLLSLNIGGSEVKARFIIKLYNADTNQLVEERTEIIQVGQIGLNGRSVFSVPSQGNYKFVYEWLSNKPLPNFSVRVYDQTEKPCW
ncbi:hypothetical protein HZI73_04250 [Vallitalea pronyensis]|uniref:Uncharacterized protein n=1 Tax=Vallitalea pronyensis TaxID=1348613 RepID=A0A8J8SFP5_9FIRM|nr:hypothetical protein [Vallitalea pronyensis]QUI21552.1 hypothetical protein HZI73_04250 [Vallitalea pronyensis]